MATDNAALFISLASAGIACVSLGWNVYRDVIFRARAKVSLSVVTIVQQGSTHRADDRPQFISLQADNLGPGPLTLRAIEAESGRWWWRLIRRKWKFAYIVADYENPLSARLPLKLEVGDGASFLLPYERDSCLQHGFHRIGFRDSFGRHLWASPRQIAAAHATYAKAFPAMGPASSVGARRGGMT